MKKSDASQGQSASEFISKKIQVAVAASQPGFEIQHVGAVPKWGWTTDKGA